MTNEITKERRDAIRAAAVEATPGPWTYGAQWLCAKRGPAGYAELAQVPLNDYDSPRWNADARYIANCDPQTIIALLDALDAAEAKMGEPVAATEPEVGECRYCANSGWFYGDPGLNIFCGCDFGKLREELSAAPPAAAPDVPAREAGS